MLMLLLAAVLWGSGNVANQTVLRDMDPFAFAAAARNLVAMLVFFHLPSQKFCGYRASASGSED